MIRAYNEALFNIAADSIGRMLDFSVHSLRISADMLMGLFTASGAATLFERGDIGLICGMSGIELAYETLERSGMEYERTSPRHTIALSPEYWCGYMLARLQWISSASFKSLLDIISTSDLIDEYKKCRSEVLNELPWNADDTERQKLLNTASKLFITKTEELYNLRIAAAKNNSLSQQTPLKRMRKRNGLSQSELAKASGVPLRTIQQYEQRQKDINKARAEYLIMLSSALNCNPRQLLNH